MILAQNDKFWKFLKLVRLKTVFLPYRKKMSEVVISTFRLKKKSIQTCRIQLHV